VDSFYAMGQRVSQLTYFDNALGGGSTSPSRGLTAYGCEVLERMNALRMVVDVSHCSDRTTLEAIECSSKPVLVTHSNCRALSSSSARCKPDVAIRKLSAKGGVFGVTMVRQFVQPRGAASIAEVLDHIDHIVSIAGVEHAGIGTDVDLDGRDKTQDLDGIQYSKKIFELAEGLVRRNYSSRHIGLILGGNFQRVLSDIWLG
jgi:membrane dipeptidase